MTSFKIVTVPSIVLGVMLLSGCNNKSPEPDASSGYNPNAGKGATGGPPQATGAHGPTAPKPPKAE